MRPLRNIGAFILVFVAIVILYPMASTAVADAFVNGRHFISYFGWFSWPPAIFLLVSVTVFLVGGVLLAWLMVSPYLYWWAFALGLIYSAIRLYLSHHRWNGDLGENIWVVLEIIVPPFAAAVGAYLQSRISAQRQRNAAAA